MRALLIHTLIFTAGLWLFHHPAAAQTAGSKSAKQQVEAYKADPRGPYKDLRWYCPDGTVLPPRERCAKPGGNQRARYKEAVVELQAGKHLFLGQILATTEQADFWDATNEQSRLKQYQMEQYLREVDDGWVWRQAQFYRGAIQAEDEADWGADFLRWLVTQNGALQQHFFLIRQAAKDISHGAGDNQAQRIRSLSQTIAEADPGFMGARIKIHGQPQASDTVLVQTYKRQNEARLTPDLLEQINQLLALMHAFYEPVDGTQLKAMAGSISVAAVKQELTTLLQLQGDGATSREILMAGVEVAASIRENLTDEPSARGRLAMLDISIALEQLVFSASAEWQPATVGALLQKNYQLAKMAAASGFIERWEWQQVGPQLAPPDSTELSLAALNRYQQLARSQVEWGTGTVKAVYQSTVNVFAELEPKARGFLDDRIRSSVLLRLGESAAALGAFIGEQTGAQNRVMDLANPSALRGLNPGYAYGELVVISGPPDEVTVAPDKIYVFERPPADLKPVAGIATVSEGNLVSHVQLLARNLGIPNAVLSQDNLDDLKRYNGQHVFFAVSAKGTVVMKSAAQMNATERALFTAKKRNDAKIRVPVDRIRLNETGVLNLRSLHAGDAGSLSGPKAANLGQLKQLFPENVVEGLVLPFGAFKRHMEQPMPGQSGSYWQFLTDMFATVRTMQERGIAAAEIDAYQLGKLQTLREAIKQMPLLPDFKTQLERSFQQVLGKPMGEVPIFIRSDTNMEDLPDFTGAGLNLTLFNVAVKENIIQGIKDVWASPYTERSFRWRQAYLQNPENVYPSILIIPSVDVDYSGVLITTGVANGNRNDLTIAFSRGAGGAVEGQVAESYVIPPSGRPQLIAPSREPFYTTLPARGGTLRKAAAFDAPILSQQNIDAIRALSDTVKRTFPTLPDVQMQGPYDMELGFKNNALWLFQVRPFVENKAAAGSGYLESLSPRIDEQKTINLNTKLSY